MTFSRLHYLLLKLEGQLEAQPQPPPRIKSLVRSKRGGARNVSAVQAFGLHKTDAWKRELVSNAAGDETRKQIVVTIGGNYTQGQVQVPRDHQALSPAVLDELSPCKQHFAEGYGEYLNSARTRTLWFKRFAASSDTILIQGDYHFVMTNFCLWITRSSWQTMPPQARAQLLQSNPHFGGQRSRAGSWTHLDKLADSLKGEKVLWVAHGKDCEVFALFRAWVDGRGTQDWLMLPNLAFPYRWGIWSFPK